MCRCEKRTCALQRCMHRCTSAARALHERCTSASRGTAEGPLRRCAGLHVAAARLCVYPRGLPTSPELPGVVHGSSGEVLPVVGHVTTHDPPLVALHSFEQ